MMHPKLRRPRITEQAAGEEDERGAWTRFNTDRGTSVKFEDQSSGKDRAARRGTQNTVSTAMLLSAMPHESEKPGADSFFETGNTFAGMSFKTVGTAVSDIDTAIQRQLEKSTVRKAALDEYNSAGGDMDVEGAAPPVTEILMSVDGRDGCTYYCKKRVCMKHFYFLIRVLPMGYVTPASELADLDLDTASSIREQEEWFILKNFPQFEELKSLFQDQPTNSTNWGESASVATLIPSLPEQIVPFIDMFGCQCGEKRNPAMEVELQRFLDTLMLQLGDQNTEFGWEEFFQTDLLDRSDPLLKEALKKHGGQFKEYAAPDEYNGTVVV